MKNEIQLTYWDSCVFVSYINGEPGRVDVIDNLFDEIHNKNEKIVTSTLTIAEVNCANFEKDKRVLDDEIEKIIQGIWDDPVINLVEVNQQIAIIAKDLIRSSIPNGFSLKPMDAIHLASAQWIDRNIMKIKEFCTYDNRLEKYQAIIGIHINTPHVEQPKLM
jgi:predicted nucleic acid-binding protein